VAFVTITRPSCFIVAMPGKEGKEGGRKERRKKRAGCNRDHAGNPMIAHPPLFLPNFRRKKGEERKRKREERRVYKHPHRQPSLSKVMILPVDRPTITSLRCASSILFEGGGKKKRKEEVNRCKARIELRRVSEAVAPGLVAPISSSVKGRKKTGTQAPASARPILDVDGRELLP